MSLALGSWQPTRAMPVSLQPPGNMVPTAEKLTKGEAGSAGGAGAGNLPCGTETEPPGGHCHPVSLLLVTTIIMIIIPWARCPGAVRMLQVAACLVQRGVSGLLPAWVQDPGRGWGAASRLLRGQRPTAAGRPSLQGHPPFHPLQGYTLQGLPKRTGLPKLFWRTRGAAW